MKITDVELHVVAPIGEAEVLGCRVGWLFVVVRTDEGVTGIGECTNWPRKGNTLVAAAVRALSEGLIGRDPARIEATWIELFRNYTYLGNRGLVTTVISAFDMALWDIKGKVTGLPVHDLLGGAVRESVPLYTHPMGATPAALAEDALRLMEQGFTAFKVDPFHEMVPHHTAYLGGEISKAGIRAAEEWVATLRDAVGRDIEIHIDFHGNYNASSALRCINALRDYDITWFEEPVPPENLEALRQIRAQTDAPLCVGERLHTRWDFVPIFRNRLANFVMPDVCWTGGISELKKISTMAEAYAVPVAPHGALGPLQAVAGAHVMLGTPNCYRLEILGSSWLPLYEACLSPGVGVRDGHLVLSDRPGLGVELDMDWVRVHSRPDFL